MMLVPLRMGRKLTGLTDDENTEGDDNDDDDDDGNGGGHTYWRKQYISNEAQRGTLKRKPNTVEVQWHGRWGLLYNLKWAMRLPLLPWKTLMTYEDANESGKERRRRRMKRMKMKK